MDDTSREWRVELFSDNCNIITQLENVEKYENYFYDNFHDKGIYRLSFFKTC